MPPIFPDLPPVVSSAGMRAADHATINKIGIPGFTLMESAGREVAKVAQEMIEVSHFDASEHELGTPRATVFCFCGSGNNGGDGFVVARYLCGYGHDVTVVLCSLSAPKGESKAHLDILMKIAGEPAITLEIVSSIDALKHKNHPDLIVDAILGTGLESTVRAPMVPFIQWMNSCGAPILAIDVPSGLSADTGHVLGHCVNAHVTVTLAALKAGLLVENGPDVVGALHVVDIGVPAFEIDRVCSSTSEIRVSNDDFVRYRMPTPDRNNHKYTTGPCLIVGGSPSYAGAPVLASQAAARSGSGYVICIGPTSIRSLLQEKLTEIPVETWGIQPSASAAQDLITQLDTRWKKAKSLLIGPGLGSEEGLAEFIIALLLNHEGPAVIDADALGLLAGEKEWVQKHSRGRWIFTPHAGEFKKLQGSLDTDINMMEAAKRFAEEWNVVLLLKGFPSVVATPTGALIINSTGQSSAATAGSGDVLAGVIAGFLARGLSPSDAAICGIHVAGTATDLYVEENAAGTMMAGDILQLLPRVLSELQ